MNIETSFDLKKGRSGEKIFAVALFLTLVVAATIAWFIFGLRQSDEDKTFMEAHNRYVRVADAAASQTMETFSAMAARLSSEMDTQAWVSALAANERDGGVRANGIFDASGSGTLSSGAALSAAQNPALRSAINSPYPHELVFGRSPFSGEKSPLYTAAFEDASGDTHVFIIEMDAAALSELLLREDPERDDILCVVAQDGSVIATSEEAPGILNLLKWAEGANAVEDLPQPLYVMLRDRIDGFGVFERDEGGFAMALTNVAGTDWMLVQIEMK